jgi:drug/metabolite transporter (DMT)-like permease
LLLDDTHAYKETSVKGLTLALGGAVCWGFANLGFKKYIPALGTLPFSMLQETIVAVVMFFLMVFRLDIKHNKQLKLAPKPIKLIFLISCCTVIGVFCTNLGMSQLPIIFFSLLVLVQPVTTLVAAQVWLKEKLTFRQQIGCILVISGLFIAMIQN